MSLAIVVMPVSAHITLVTLVKIP